MRQRGHHSGGRYSEDVAITGEVLAVVEGDPQLASAGEVLHPQAQKPSGHVERGVEGPVDGDVIALDAPGFYEVDNEFQDGDPPLHPNCKCELIPVLLSEEKVYTPNPNVKLLERIKELEAKADKRTKAFKELKAKDIDNEAYIKALEKYLDVG